MKYFLLALVSLPILSCKNQKIKIEEYSIFQSSESFFTQYSKEIEKYKERTEALEKKMIICNQPFFFKESPDLMVFFNDALVYSTKINQLKIPEIKEGELINVMIAFSNQKGIFRLNNKIVYPHSNQIDYYYLSFYPSNDNHDSFKLIPSSVKLI